VIENLAKSWWLIALRGLVAIVFGLLALLWPGLTLGVLILLFGAFVLFDGVFAIVAAIAGHSMAPRGWLAVTGVAGIAAGALTFFWPGITGLVLLWLIAAWAIVIGVMQIIAAVQLRKEMTGEWRLILGGILSAAFGVLVLFWPVAGALALALLIGVYALADGILLLGFSFRLWRYAREGQRSHPRQEHRPA